MCHETTVQQFTKMATTILVILMHMFLLCNFVTLSHQDIQSISFSV